MYGMLTLLEIIIVKGLDYVLEQGLDLFDGVLAFQYKLIVGYIHYL